MASLQNISLGTRYMTSMYGVLNIVEGANTDAERIFGLVGWFVLIFLEGAVAGLMSSLLIGMNTAEAEINAKLRVVQVINASSVSRAGCL
jgi:hypothetical protein